MTQSQDNDQQAEIVDRLYDVAMDPMRLEELMNLWEGRGMPVTWGDQGIDNHMSRAHVFLERYDAVGDGDGKVSSVLDDLHRTAAFLSDGKRGIVACNRAVRQAFGLEEGAPLSALPLAAHDLRTLDDTIRRVVSDARAAVTTLRLRSTVTEGPVIMRVSRVAERGALALVQSTELVWPEGFEATVQDAFGLTAAEVEIVRGISMGLPVRDIAESRGRSVDTVRTQLRSILSKTETHSQSELIRVVLGLMDLPRPVIDAGGRQPYRSLRLADGRKLDWIEFGDPRGVPVLYMHADFGLIHWPASAERRATRMGLRVIAPVRAGYGGSDLHKKTADHLEGVTADYAAVLDHLGVRKVAILVLGAPLRFAMNLSLRRPGLVSGIVGCATRLPIRTAMQYERMEKWQRFVLANARHAPKVLPFIVKAAFSVARKMGKIAFFRHINSRSPADLGLIDAPETREALLAGSEICLSNDHSAHEAFTRECIGAEKDWSHIIHACIVPVILLQGDQDPQTPPITIHELHLEYPHLRVEFLPENGELLFFKEWETALRRIATILPDRQMENLLAYPE